MGPCLAAPHLCWASGLLAFLNPLLNVCSTLAKGPEARGSGVLDSGLHFPVKGTQGGSVLFHVVQQPGWAPGQKLEEISWGFGPESAHRVFLRVHNGTAPPTWVSLQDKFKTRVHVPNTMSLTIENVTSQDSGHYRAQVRFTGGFSSTQVFHLTVYEPVPAPQILAESPSITSGWCNVTLQCRATGATEQLNVSWESTGPPSELKQGGAPGPANNSWTLAVSLPLSQPKASLTCVVSNQRDQRSTTLDLGDVCVQEADSRGQPTAGVVGGILGAVLLLILGAGLYLWRTRGKKKRKKRKKQKEEEEKQQEEEEETDRGAALQRDHRGDDGGMHYAQLMKEETQDGQEKAVGRQHLGEQESIMTIYSQIHSPGQGMKII